MSDFDMKVDLLFPVLPPTLDGIGDHTALLASALSTHVDVRILTSDASFHPVEGVDVVPAYSLEKRSGIVNVFDAARSDPPDWLFVQFNQFSYGRWGLNPYLPRTLRRIKEACPGVRVAWMAHEDFVPPTSWKFVVMRQWQRAQFKALGAVADRIFFSIEAWVEKYRSWFPSKPVSHLPVGSNIPYIGFSKEEAREQLSIDQDALVIGVFGTLNASRPLDYIVAAIRRVVASHSNVVVLFVGPDGRMLQSAVNEIPVRDAGVLDSNDVSVHVSCMDVHLTPYIDGVSSRRGAFLAGIQHGVPTVTTLGVHSDSFLKASDGEVFVSPAQSNPGLYANTVLELVTNASKQQTLAREGRAFYLKHFTYEGAAQRVYALLSNDIA